MFDFQLKLFNDTTQAAVDFTDEYVSALKDAFEAVPQSIDAIDEAETPSTPEPSQPFALPKIPEAGGSWYRPPNQNPVTEFWEQLLKPWRSSAPMPVAAGIPFSAGPFSRTEVATVPNAWLAAQGALEPFSGASLFGQDLFGGNKELPDQVFKPWFALWGDGAEEPAEPNPFDQLTQAAKATLSGLDPAQIADGNWKALVAYQSEAGMAMARMYFPDHTIVSLPIPIPKTFDGLLGWKMPSL